MSQATFDPATPGGPSDQSNETQAPRAANASGHRRPSRRGRAAATPKTPETTPEATTPEAVAAQPTPDEQAAKSESRSRRSRGGAKRPAARGKAGAQLIINKPADGAEGQPGAATQTETHSEIAAQVAAPVASEPVAAPTVVPVVSAGAEAAPTPRKTRFGLPSRFRKPETTPAAAPAATPLAMPAEPVESSAAAEPAAAVVPVVEKTALPRYRFDRSRGASASAAIAPRPERLASQRDSLYTEAEKAAEAPAAPPTQELAERPAPTPIFDLPSLDTLVGGSRTELPTLAFEAPEAVSEPAAAEADEGAESSTESGEADGAAGSSRRRRRRRRGPGTHAGAHDNELDEAADDETPPAADYEPQSAATAYEEDIVPQAEPSYAEESYAEPQRGGRSDGPRGGRSGRLGYTSRTPRRAPSEPTWEPAPQQQPAADITPYGSPEPAYARGFGPTPAGVATPARETYPRPSRVERGVDTGTAQLGMVIREAISTQTDRLLNELRRQQPPSVTLALPSAATAERVAVFVDVANVVYSARSLRTSVDFGHLLDFLRANRRLARAQAYAPTNPEPGADQAFLNAVKGMGYRITTKNYKTFANGAKKADLDLDLCMDIVRIVEAKAVDTIVLVSGDSDFLPLLEFCSDHGVRVEVAAFDDAASMILRQSCDLFVNLSLVEGIRG